MTDDDWISLAQRVARAVLGGHEPSAAGIYAYARDLQDPAKRRETIAALEKMREELYKVAWTGSRAFDPYDLACDAIEELEGLDA
jgi:hypothetical protein